MDGPLDDPHDRDAQIARQLPVISAQRDSLAAVMLTRWLRLSVAHGPGSLEVTHHHRQERWELRWHTSNHRAHAVEAATLAELFCACSTRSPRRSSGAGLAGPSHPSAPRAARMPFDVSNLSGQKSSAPPAARTAQGLSLAVGLAANLLELSFVPIRACVLVRWSIPAHQPRPARPEQ